MPSFDASQYLAANTDLIRAGITEQTALAHYNQYGQYEHRSTTFDALTYVASNTDLIQAFGANTTAATQHYIQYGYQEQRSTSSFSAVTYEASNTDLITAFGTNTAAAAQHYIQYGYQEHRSTSSFNAATYEASNADLISVFGTDTAAAALHYIQYGYQEQRSTSGFSAAAYVLANNLTQFNSAAEATMNYIQSGFSQHLSTTYSFSDFDSSAYYSSNSDIAIAFNVTTTTTTTVSYTDMAMDHYLNYGVWEHRRFATPTFTPAVQTIQTGVSTVSGSLTTGNSLTYGVVLTAGTTYTFDELGASTSNGALRDPYLRLYNSNNTLLTSNDDGGVGLNARITYRPNQTGIYYISAGSFLGNGSGDFTLQVTAPEALSATYTGGTPGTDAGLTHAVGSGASFTGQVVYGYRSNNYVTLTGGRRYSIDLEGSSTSEGTLNDPYLRVYNASALYSALSSGSEQNYTTGAQLASNDDSGTGLNSRLTFTAPSTGVYDLQAGSAGNYGAGSYLLTVRAA